MRIQHYKEIWRKIKLAHLIIGIIITIFMLSSISFVWNGYQANIDSVRTHTLEMNRVYAQKLATTSNGRLQETFGVLDYSANILKNHMHDEELLNAEVDRLRLQYQLFNTVFIVTSEGKVQSVSPLSLNVKGQILTTAGPQEALTKKVPIVSKPYMSLVGELAICISTPIISDEGKYLGMLGGLIYLNEKNIFHTILGEHFYNDDSYVFVVDGDGRIIYHQDKKRVNDIVLENPVVRKVIIGESGAEEVVNTKGIKMLAGYAPIPLADWGVISQRPLDAALNGSNEQLQNMLVKAIPFTMILAIIIIWIVSWIVRPLQQLATFTERSAMAQNMDSLKSVQGWYFEAHHLKNILIKNLTFLQSQISYFKDQSTTDALTGLTNRRTIDAILAEWCANNIAHAIILVDVDNFKQINDRYGHPVGDSVLQFLANTMEKVAREQDVCCRYGGEEFIILLPHTDAEEAKEIAEQLRKKMMHSVSPCGYPVTLSAGVATYPQSATNRKELIEAADNALYRAKEAGRNCVIQADQH
ncbi:sensor domain-containing diguanylate cyclase [Lysinibacillus piscis]|uniref:Cell signaling regulator n=1 Tax=Lysinibacillus piscis TaxID=2518931 RepID=A0ABQ5NPA6_9BACI|nr:sensor domain-containing diguanylate cyclase [Lysinibacillus sp. KH24]GLC90149.1 cell signaling regulator [Lysinibacillus sp. KH24]